MSTILERYKHKLKTRIEAQNRTKLENVIPLSTPFIINVDPSDRCNFQCKFCPSGDRVLMKSINRPLKTMDFDIYKKIINDISEFDMPIKVLRLYKDGEPLLNPKFADMVAYAKSNPKIMRVDTTTNASLLNPKRNMEIINAGLDRINISIEGIDAEQYKSFSNYKMDFDKFVDNISHFYDNSRGKCEVFIKINGDILPSEKNKIRFFEIFGEICDGINIEHVMSCWPEFELKEVEVNKEKGIYGQEITYVYVCPYVFYSFSINSDGTASACFLDWARRLLIGDVRVQKVRDIWLGKEMKENQKMFLRHERRTHPFCKDCGQLTHGMPDNIDKFAEELLKKIKESTG